MNTVLVLIVLPSVFSISSAAWFPDVQSTGEPNQPQKRDCEWMQWTETGLCEKRGPNIYGIKRKRERIPARKGGKSCDGSATSYIPCAKRQNISSVFFETINAQLHAEIHGGGGDGGVEKVDPLNEDMRTRTKRQALSDSTKRDVLFLLDESGSVGSSNFMKEVRMARALVNTFCGAIGIGEDKTRIGIVSFDKFQHRHLDFDDQYDKSKVLSHLDNNVKYTSESSEESCLYDALEYTRTSMFHENRGARVKATDVGTEQLLILFTDGCASCEKQQYLPTLLKISGIKFEQEKISIIVFLVGKEKECLKNIQGLLTGTRCSQLYRLLNWAEFDKTTLTVEAMRCMNTWQIGPACST